MGNAFPKQNVGFSTFGERGAGRPGGADRRIELNAGRTNSAVLAQGEEERAELKEER